MVNIGGPSKGCTRCKRLKVKCDEAKPECLRCGRAKQKCTGYADTENFDAKIRYETGLGSRRVTRSRRSKQKSPVGIVPSQKPASKSEASIKKDGSLLEAAVLLFKTAHAASYGSVYFSWNSASDDCLARCISIMKESDEDSGLRHAISAVYNGLYSFISKSKEMEQAAETSFAAAVSLARAALDDPIESKSDSTLLTVLLLSMFEAAVVLGGETETLKELLDLSKSLPLPCNMQPTNSLASLSARLAGLRLQMDNLNLCSGFDVQRTTLLMQLAEQTDGDLMGWPDYVPPSCQPKKAVLDIYPNYPDWEDRYPSLAVAQDWNHYRYLRIMANIIISRCAALLRRYSQAAAADQICEQMVDEVCASIIYYIGRLKINDDNDEEDESDDEDLQMRKTRCLDEKYGIAVISAMLILPKLRWILQAEPSLRPKQKTCLQLNIKKILQFYRNHGVENVEIPEWDVWA